MSDGRRLTAAQYQQLQRQLLNTPDARLYRRTWAVLQVLEGADVVQVAEDLRVDRRSVYRWLESYWHHRDPAELADRPGRGRPGLWYQEDLEAFESLLGQSPQALGYPASQWTVPLLRSHLEQADLPACSQSSLRRRLEELDRVWKRPRYMLEPDPHREKKTPHPAAAGRDKCPARRAFRG